VAHVRFSPDGKYLAAGVDSGRTCIYDVKTWAKSWSVPLFRFGERRLTFVKVSSQIPLKQTNEPFKFGVSVSLLIVNI